MSQPVSFTDAQDLLLEVALDLYRIIQRLHHQFEYLKAQHEHVREYYEAEEPPMDQPPTLERAVAEETDITANQLLDVAEDLLKSARLTEPEIQAKWRRNR